MKIWEFYETRRWIQRDFIVDEHGVHVPLMHVMRMQEEIERNPTTYPSYGFCLLGATSMCYPESTQRVSISRKLWNALNESPIAWNDRETRTKEDVVALCKALDI